MTGDLPEGQQPKSDLQVVPASVYEAANATYVDEEGRLGTSAAIRATVRVAFAAGRDAEAARVRADVAEDIARELERIADSEQAPMAYQYRFAMRSAARLARKRGGAPAESVVGAPTPAAAPSDLAEVEYGLRRDGYVARYDSREKAECWAAESLPDWELVSRRVGVWESAPPVGALPEDEGTRQEGLINVEE